MCLSQPKIKLPNANVAAAPPPPPPSAELAIPTFGSQGGEGRKGTRNKLRIDRSVL